VERIFAEARSSFDIEVGGGSAQATGEFSDENYIEDENGEVFETA
jgi:hypothetical protein